MRRFGFWLLMLVAAAAVGFVLLGIFGDPIDATPENVAKANALLAVGQQERWLIRIDEGASGVYVHRASWDGLTEKERDGLLVTCARHFKGAGGTGEAFVYDQSGRLLARMAATGSISRF